jgi:hypothetical protein
VPDALLIATVDWTAASSLATAAGTLVLAVATFAAVRSANRSARASERALLAGIRPVLVSSRFDDAEQKVGFMDDRYFRVGGGRASVEITDDAIYLVMSIRNVGSGIAVLDRWFVHPGGRYADDPREPSAFRRLTRDLYIPAGDIGFWQGALRDRDDPDFDPVATAVRDRTGFAVDILYADHEGGQRTITRFGILPAGEAGWLASIARHWHLDRDAPR